MKARIGMITLGVADLSRAVAFYRDGLGLPLPGFAAGDDHAAIELAGGLTLMLVPRAELGRLGGPADAREAQEAEEAGLFARSAPETLLTYVAETRAEVTGIVRDAEAAGGSSPRPPSERAWGYLGYFRDPDGHLWEVVWHSGGPEEPRDAEEPGARGDRGKK